MGSNVDWMPTNRAGRRKMAKDWLNAFDQTPSGQSMVNRDRWRLTDALESQLGAKVAQIDTLEDRPTQLHTVDSRKELTDAYDELTKIMRKIKSLCFMRSALTDRDYIVLGLKIPDTTPTSVKPPQVMPVILHAYKGSLTIEFTVQPQAGGTTDGKADYGLKFKGCIVPRGEPDGRVSPSGIAYKLDGAPTEEFDLSWDMFTRKKKFTVTFHQLDFEGRFYFCARYENSKGEGGPWSPIAFAVIV